MKAVRLITRRDGEFDTRGLALAGLDPSLDYSVDTEGGLLAHDLLEHQNGIANIGSVWDELEALGGVWHVRGRWGDMARKGVVSLHPPEGHIAADVARMFFERDEYEYVPHEHRLTTTRPCGEEDALHEIVSVARRRIREEANWRDQSTDGMEDYLDMARARFRVGLRKARKRFGDSSYAYGLFCAVRDAVAEATKLICYEGQEFTLLYGKGEARITERPTDWD